MQSRCRLIVSGAKDERDLHPAQSDVRADGSYQRSGHIRQSPFVIPAQPGIQWLLQYRPQDPRSQLELPRHRALVRARPTVSTRIGPCHPDAVLRNADGLHAARRFQRSGTVQPMSQAFEPTQHIVTELRLDRQAPIALVRPVGSLALLGRRPARCLQGSLRVGARSISAVNTCRLTCT